MSVATGKLKQSIKDTEKYQSSMSLLQKCNVRCNFSRVVCKTGKKVRDICNVED
jgi:U6 snRNA phosphodiesterase